MRSPSEALICEFGSIKLRQLFYGLVLIMGFNFLNLGTLRAQSSNAPLGEGATPYSSLHGGDLDSILLNNGNLLLHIPLVSYPQRGQLHLGFFLVYDNRLINVDHYTISNGSYIGVGVSGLGLHFVSDLSWQNVTPAVGNAPAAYQAHTPDGASHPMANTTAGYLSIDATGFKFDPTSNTLSDHNGVRYSAPGAKSGFAEPTRIEDPSLGELTVLGVIP